MAMSATEPIIASFKVETLIVWSFPMESWVHWCIDGSCKDENRDDCGGIIKRSSGEWLGGFPKYVGVGAFV